MAQESKPATVKISDGGWREWLRLDDEGISVRNFLQTYRIGWHEVRRFEDGSESGRRGRHWWALRIVLRDGRVIIADGTSSLKTAARLETLTAIRQAAERHGVPAVFTGNQVESGAPDIAGLYRDPGGKPGLREWTGTEWSPSLHVAPASSDPAGEQAPDGCGRLFPGKSCSGTGTM
jgi:hypothetical protein